MERRIGTVSMGVRAPIVREGGDIVAIVSGSVLAAARSGGRAFRARDAAGLARMWNESDAAWTGSWTDGVPLTAEVVREREESQRLLVTYIA